ncbi:MAG: O-antigen ligase family protein [Actinobacteria bacterium]|nr:O-antigen ligase family protein [Actinomycetota bacterium]MCG2801782.1 O-antigen ligase family protein [Cellulomonas sp.]
MTARSSRFDARCGPGGRDPFAPAALAALATAPLALVPGGMSRFVLPKLAVFALFVAFAAVGERRGRVPRPVALAIAGGALWLVVAACAGAAPSAQLVGRWPRYEGLVALPVYVGCLWAGARLLGPAGDQRPARLLPRALSATAIIATAVALAEAAGLRPLGGDATRLGGLVGNASQEGALGAVLLCVLLPWAVRERGWLVPAGAVCAGLLTVLSGSRGALLAAVLGVLVLLRVRSGGRAVLLAAGFALGGLVAASLVLPVMRNRLLGSDTLATATVTGRWDLWGETVRVLAHRWLTGAGPSGFYDLFAVGSSDGWQRAHGVVNPPDSPHDLLLQTWSAGGVVLVLIAALLAVAVARAATRARRIAGVERRVVLDGATGGLVAGIVALMVGFTHASTTPLLAALAGALVASVPVGAPAARRVIERVVAGAAVVWTVAAVLACLGEVALQRGATLATAGRVEAASAQFENAQRLRPWDPDVAVLATEAFAAGTDAGDEPSAAAARTWSSRALGRVGRSQDVERVQGVALGVLGEPAAGLQLLAPLLADDPDNLDLLLAHGTLAAQTGDPGTALADFTRATEVAPDDETAWSDLRVVATWLGDRNALARVTQHQQTGG